MACLTSTWVYVWRMTPDGVGHVGIQVGGERPGDHHGIYRSVHPLFPVFGPFVVYPMPLVQALSWQEDARSESKDPNQEFKLPDVIFYSNRLNVTKMIEALDSESKDFKYQLIPGIHPWKFFDYSAEDVTYQPLERIYSPSQPLARVKTHNCATYVAEVLRAGGVELKPTSYPWRMSPNSVMDQLSSNPLFVPVKISLLVS